MKLYSRNDLRDSRIFFDKKPPKFWTIFIIITLLLIVFLSIASAYMVKPYIVKAAGTITTKDNTYVGMLSDGVIVEINKPEGEEVRKDDVLFTVSNGTEGSEFQGLNNQYTSYVEKEDAMNKFEKSLNEDVNYMNNSGNEQEYYGKMEYYLSLLRSENNNNLSIIENLNESNNKVTKIENEIAKLENNITNYDTSNESEALKKNEDETEISTKNAELESLKKEISNYETQLNGESQAYQAKAQLISELGTARSTNNSAKSELETQMNIYKTKDSLYEVKATNDGFVHYLSPIKVGMSMQKSQMIAEISFNKNENMIVESYIQAHDISKVKIGDKVNVALNGVDTQKYGTLRGKVESIDIGTITQETSEGNIVLYRCVISLDNKNLKSSDHETITVIKSMQVESRIVYEEDTYFDWMLSMLNFSN